MIEYIYARLIDFVVVYPSCIFLVARFGVRW